MKNYLNMSSKQWTHIQNYFILFNFSKNIVQNFFIDSAFSPLHSIVASIKSFLLCNMKLQCRIVLKNTTYYGYVKKE